MPISRRDTDDWEKFLNIPTIFLPPKEFCDVVKPMLDKAFKEIESSIWSINSFKGLEKNTILSVVYDAVNKGHIKPEDIVSHDSLVAVVLEIITLNSFIDLQTSFAVLHYRAGIKGGLVYGKRMEDIECARSFSTSTYNITSHNIETIVRNIYEKYYLEIRNSSIYVPMSDAAREVIKLCGYTEEQMREDMDKYLSGITGYDKKQQSKRVNRSNGEKITKDELNLNSVVESGRYIPGPQVKEETIKQTKGENKMVKLNSVAISTMNGALVVKTREGKYVAYDKQNGTLQEHMEEFVISDDKMITVIPAIKVAVGDIISVNGNLLYVKSISEKVGAVTAVDFENATEEKLVKTTNAFNVTYYNKVVSITQMTQAQEKLTAAEAQQLMTLLFLEDNDITDIGRMILLAQLQNVEAPKEGEEAPAMGMMNPMMLMAMKDGKGQKDNMLKMMMLSQAFGGNGAGTNPMANPMMLMMLMGDKEGLDDKMMKLMMMSQMTAGNQATGINPMMLMMMNK